MLDDALAKETRFVRKIFRLDAIFLGVKQTYANLCKRDCVAFTHQAKA
jgi:hypothetical protein